MEILEIRKLTTMDLPTGDVVVSAIAFQGDLIVVTRFGTIFRIRQEYTSG